MSSYVQVMFFSDQIKIIPKSATESKFVGNAVTVKEFATRYSEYYGRMVQYPCALYENEDTGNLRVELRNFDMVIPANPTFIQGREVIKEKNEA